ncbi:MAG: IS21 family transposase [Anaerolineae bacterium]|nr:IS21 family transposase [Anaerolineae bacterium]
MEIREMIVRLRAGDSNRQIGRDLGIDRRTVKSYRQWAERQELLAGAVPEVEALQRLVAETLPSKLPPQNVSSVEPYRKLVEKLVAEKVETAAIHQRLKERKYKGSYSAVYRFVNQIKGQRVAATVRVERSPGEEGQVDFGYGGLMVDPETGRPRRTWACVMTLSWSRHQYVEFVWNQKVETWLGCHRNAFNFFGGVPERVVIDNLKAAILRAVQDDPMVQASYQECALHYGFLIGPCRPGTPEHKGKVEQGGVHYVKRNFLGGREATTISQANRDVLVWCQTTAGQRIHGTTKEQPLQRFEETEQARLQALPQTPYEIAVWKELTVSRDCYVEFDHSYYSVPYRLINQKVRVCGNLQQVRIFNSKYQWVATHDRATKAGTRRTHLDHLPPEKVPGLTLNRENCRQEAEKIGPATGHVAQTLLDDPIVDRLPTVGRLLKLGQQYGSQRLEAACERAIAFDDPSYITVRGILRKGLEQEPPPDEPTAAPATTFVRPLTEVVGSWLGGLSWR